MSQAAGETIDSQFELAPEHRQSLKHGRIRPLLLEQVPEGCEPGATYVISWSRPSRSLAGDVVIDIPREPMYWLTVTRIVRHKSGGYLVWYDTMDRREPDLFLAPGSGYTNSRTMAVDDLAVVCDKHVREVYDRDRALRLERAIAQRQQWKRTRRAAQREMRRRASTAPAAA